MSSGSLRYSSKPNVPSSRTKISTQWSPAEFSRDFRTLGDAAIPGIDRLAPLPAHPHPPAGAAEIAVVLPDYRVVAAFRAAHALHFRRGAGHGRRKHAHGLNRVAFFVEDAEHGVAVDDEARDVRHRRGPVLLPARARRERHEIAERFGVVQQLAQ